MKLYHFGLIFAVIAIGFLVTMQVRFVGKQSLVEREKTEYDVLVAAVDATVDAVFAGGENTVTEERLFYGEKVFFQTMAVLQEGATDRGAWEAKRAQVPCLAVFEERGYYLYCRTPEKGYGWSELYPYEDGQIPEAFFSETEKLLKRYHSEKNKSIGSYRMESAGKGVWEQSLTPPCVFAVYAQENSYSAEADGRFLYAASGQTATSYLVTEDNYCHVPYCEKCKNGNVVAWYATQKESAEDGAMPCEICMK